MNALAVTRAAETPVLLRERNKDIAILLLNRPQARNSLSEALLIELSDAFSEIADDQSIRGSRCSPRMGRLFVPVTTLKNSRADAAIAMAAAIIFVTS